MNIFGYNVSLLSILIVAILAAAVIIFGPKVLKEGFSSSEKTLVLYFAPWCGHCKKLKPEWEKLEKSGIKGVTISKVNSDEEESKTKEAGVDSYPTIILYNKGEKQVYSGPRNADAIAKWAESA
jgi:protein disulfide-isomerase-like protein